MRHYLLILTLATPFLLFSCKKDGDSNQAPSATEVTLSGFDQVGLTKKLTYSYADVENDPAGSPIYKWYRYNSDGSGKAIIQAANSETYTLQPADEGKKISASVTPTSTKGKAQGSEVESALSFVVDAKTTGLQTNAFVSKTPGGVQIQADSWSSTDTVYKTIVSSKAFLGNGYLQYKVAKGSNTTETIFTSAIGKVSGHDWGLQHDFRQSRLAFMENREDIAGLGDFSFSNDYFRWYREGTKITLRHSPTENGEYIILYTSPYASAADEAIYFAGGTKGIGNGVTDAKIMGEYVVNLK